MSQIVGLHAREILDSRGWPTVECEATLEDGSTGRASVPSGASTGSHEALELRDQDANRYSGKGVTQAVEHINDQLATSLQGSDASDQAAIDNELVLRDGTPNLATFGANAILAVSLAVSQAAADSLKLPYYRYIRHLYNRLAGSVVVALPATLFHLPKPMFNILNGGAHTDWQSTDFQEFMIVPISSHSFSQSLEWGSTIYHTFEKVLTQRGLTTLVGDEGGFAPLLSTNQQALELLIEAITTAGFKPGEDIELAIDAACSELYKGQSYHLPKEGVDKTTNEMITYWQELVKKYPLASLEDGLAEDDWSGWQALHQGLGEKIRLVGDDLLVTSSERISKAISLSACNSLLMKVNQIGTLSDAIQAAQLARSANWKIIVSHRSGETEDTSIADIAVGIDAEYVKMGAPARSERTAKYNQLLRIEEQLQHSRKTAGG